MTNAGWIRSLSKEELAEMFLKFCENSKRCYDCPLYEVECSEVETLEAWEAWARKEHK